MTPFRRKHLLLAGAALLLAGGGGNMLWAQLEGADRGIPPIDSSSNFEVNGIEVDVAAETASEARQEGWRQAQQLGWARLWSRTVNRPENQAPDLSDAVLNQIVSGIIVEDEQIGATRYIARLGLLFDRARTGQMMGVGGAARRSAPMLVIPVMRTGSTPYVFEFQSPWQYAWAQFRTSTSAVDYVRPVGSGIDPLLLNAAQTGRRSRGWWRALLDQYGASDIVTPEVELRRAFPGGPAVGRFTARHGPDAQALGTFELRAPDAASVPRMLAEGVQRLDALYVQAFNEGLLAPDPSLIPPTPPPLPSLLPPEEDPDERRPQRRPARRPAGDDPVTTGPPQLPIITPPPAASPPPPPPEAGGDPPPREPR